MQIKPPAFPIITLCILILIAWALCMYGVYHIAEILTTPYDHSTNNQRIQ